MLLRFHLLTYYIPAWIDLPMILLYFLSASEMDLALLALGHYYRCHYRHYHIVGAINDMPIKYEEYISAA
jgi:hypothetical protein